jgi:glycosyltransferase involved in cell wall biosynthesis
MSETELPLVSVLVPLYNHEAYIATCLDSIVADAYPLKELIVIDDGSQDGSAAVVQQWQERNAEKFSGNIIFVSRKNRGISSTLNELIGRASGNYLAFVSSDDYLLSDSISVRMNYLLAHPGKMLVLCDYQVVDRDGAVLFHSGIEEYFRGDKRCLAHEELIAYEIIYRWSVSGPVYLYRKEAFSIIGRYDEQLIVEDWDICLKLAARNLVGFVDYTGAAYRLHGANVVCQPEMERRMLENQIVTALRHLDSFTGLKRSLLKAYINQARLDLLRLEGSGGYSCYHLARILAKLVRWCYRRKVAATLGTVK